MTIRVVLLAVALSLVAPAPASAGACSEPAPRAWYAPTPESLLGTALRSADDVRTNACDGDTALQVAGAGLKPVVQHGREHALLAADDTLLAAANAYWLGWDALHDVHAFAGDVCVAAAHDVLGLPAHPSCTLTG